MSKYDVEPEMKSGFREDEKVYSHNAFGQIGASRVSGRTTLYGSDFIHQNFVTITVRRSELHRSLSRDWHMGRDELVSVKLSEAQWATFVSAMNVGSGVPCTIEHVVGERMNNIPFRDSKDDYKNEIKETVQDSLNALNKLKAKIVSETSGLSKSKQGVLLEEVNTAIREIGSNIPFVSESFDEHVEISIEQAKVELHGYMNHVMAQRSNQIESAKSPLLLENDENDKS